MVDIQSATAEIRRGKEKDRKIETTGQKYNVRICYAASQGGHNKSRQRKTKQSKLHIRTRTKPKPH